MKYTYDIAVLGLRRQYEARSLPELRQRILSKYLTYIGPDQRHWPVVPTIMLLGTNDPRVPRAEVPDPRLNPSVTLPPAHADNATNPVISILDWKNRASDANETNDAIPAETDLSS